MSENVFAPILVAEDEEDHSRLILKALKGSTSILNDIHLVENGQEALDFLRKEGAYKNNTTPLPALVLLDVKMPMKNGFEVLVEIRNDDKLKRLPIVMLTTTSTSEDIEKAMELGANDYIVKPIKFNDFSEKVSKLGYYWGLVSDLKNINKG